MSLYPIAWCFQFRSRLWARFRRRTRRTVCLWAKAPFHVRAETFASFRKDPWFFWSWLLLAAKLAMLIRLYIRLKESHWFWKVRPKQEDSVLRNCWFQWLIVLQNTFVRSYKEIICKIGQLVYILWLVFSRKLIHEICKLLDFDIRIYLVLKKIIIKYNIIWSIQSYSFFYCWFRLTFIWNTRKICRFMTKKILIDITPIG